jgi:hypothetical protein
MKNWTFNIKGEPKEIVSKLKAGTEAGVGFMFSTTQEDDTILFKLRSRIQFAEHIIHRNKIVVKGKISKQSENNESGVEITFYQHFLMTLSIIIFFSLSVFLILAGLISGTAMWVISAVFFIVGLLLWIGMKQKFIKDIKQYKSLISDILELE